MREEILDIDDFLDNPGDEKVFFPKKKSNKLSKGEQILYGDNEVDDEPKKKRAKSSTPKKVEEPIEMGTSLESVRKNAKAVIKNFIKKSPDYKNFQSQLKVLNEKRIEYKKLGDDENVLVIEEEISRLKNKFEQFKRVLASSTDKKEVSEKLQSSPEIKECNKKLKELNEIIPLYQKNALLNTIKDGHILLDKSDEIIKEFLGYEKPNKSDEDYDQKIKEYNNIDIDSELTGEVEDLENVIDIVSGKALKKNLSVKQRLEIAYNRISEITDTPVVYLKKMKFNELSKLLNQSWNEELVEQYEEFISKKIEISAKKNFYVNQIKGYNDISDIAYSMFDYDDDNIEVMVLNPGTKKETKVVIGKDDLKDKKIAEIKNAIASKYIGFVTKQARSIANNLNMPQRTDDAFGFGCLGMSKALNKWFINQMEIAAPISFIAIASPFIINEIKRGMYEFTDGGGMISGSNYSDKLSREKTRKKAIKKEIIESGIPEKIIETFGTLDDYVDLKFEQEQQESKKFSGVSNESSLTLTDDEGNTNDVFGSNPGFYGDNKDENTFAECEEMYKDILEGLRIFFSSFELTPTGKTKKNAIFTDRDFEVFQYLLGFYKKNTNNGLVCYTQDEIGKIIGTSQANVSASKKKLEKYIAKISSSNKKVEKAFKYMLYMAKTNPNSYDELKMTTNLKTGKKRHNTITEKYEEAKLNSVKLNTVFSSNVEPDDDLMVDEYTDLMNF